MGRLCWIKRKTPVGVRCMWDGFCCDDAVDPRASARGLIMTLRNVHSRYESGDLQTPCKLHQLASLNSFPFSCHHLPEDGLQDSAVAVILDLDRRIDAAGGFKGLVAGFDDDRLAGFE